MPLSSKDVYFNSLKKVTAADGRHCLVTAELGDYFSEHALHKYRFLVEIAHLILLTRISNFNIQLSKEEQSSLLAIAHDFNEHSSEAIAEYDHFGRNGLGPFEHDVKSVEIYLREKLKETQFEKLISLTHFGLTSEDVNNIAYACMLRGGINEVWLPRVLKICDLLEKLTIEHKDTPMLSRTHGQPASPTTFGKETAFYLNRLTKQIRLLRALKLNAKVSGAVGNNNALKAALPEVDWVKYGANLVESFGFDAELITNQRGPKEKIVELFQIMLRVNNIIRDLDVDFWLYTSRNLVVQNKVESHVGSSVMPHKINPWTLEGSEGSVKISNALIEVICRDLDVSRLQRDLSDTNLERNYGTAVAHSLIALNYTSSFLSKVSVNSQGMLTELRENPQVLSEGFQTILRLNGVENAYDLMKSIFRGNETFDPAKISEVINSLNINEQTKLSLKNLVVENYTGDASRLAQIAVENYQSLKNELKAPLSYGMWEEGL